MKERKKERKRENRRRQKEKEKLCDFQGGERYLWGRHQTSGGRGKGTKQKRKARHDGEINNNHKYESKQLKQTQVIEMH